MKFAAASLILLASGILSGCASRASPVLHEGQFYWLTDTECPRGENVTPTRIRCYDEKGVELGYTVDAMTQYQMQWWLAQQPGHGGQQNVQTYQQNGQSDVSVLTEAIRQASESIARSTEAARNQQLYTPPPIGPIAPPRERTTCLINGRYIYCRDR